MRKCDLGYVSCAWYLGFDPWDESHPFTIGYNSMDDGYSWPLKQALK